MARAMHRRCCWPPERPSAFCLSLSFTSSHSAALRRACSTRSSISALREFLVVADAVGDVLEDRHRERHRLLEHHADLAAQAVHRITRVEDVLAVEQDLAVGLQLRVDRVDAVEDAQQGRLAAAGRADDRGDLLLGDVHVDALQRVEIAVVEVQVAHRDLWSARRRRLRLRAAGGCRRRRIQSWDTLLRERSRREARLSSSTNMVTTKAPAQARACQASHGLVGVLVDHYRQAGHLVQRVDGP